MRPVLFSLVLLAVLLGPPSPEAAVYMSREEALKMAFPDVDSIKTVNLYLTEAQQQEVSRGAGVAVDPVQMLYAGEKGGKITGYAVIEAAVVRTLPETLLVVLEPDGRVRFVEVLAFFEPEEYKPSRRWLDQFRSRRLSPDLRIGGDIQGITGATLSAQAVARQVRKSAALVSLQGGR